MTAPTYEEALRRHDEMMTAYRRARELVALPVAEPIRYFWGRVEPWVHWAEEAFLGMTPRDWEFPTTAHLDSMRWLQIRAKAVALEHGLAEMQLFGTREDTRIYMASGQGGVRLRLEAARQDRMHELAEFHSALSAVKEVARERRAWREVELLDSLPEPEPPDRESQAAVLEDPGAGILVSGHDGGMYAPLGGQGIPPLRSVVGQFPWDGAAGESYRDQFRSQIEAAKRLGEVAYKSLFVLRTLRITYLDMIGGFVAMVIGITAAIFAFIVAVLTFAAGVTVVSTISFAGAAVAAVVSVVNFFVTVTKNMDSLQVGMQQYRADLADLLRSPSWALPGGRWPDPTAHDSLTSPYVAHVVRDADGTPRLISPINAARAGAALRQRGAATDGGE